jgi:hypothetical protein
VKLGVHEKVPLVFAALVVKVLPVVAGEEDAVSDVIGWPSGSDDVTVKVISAFSLPEAVAGDVTTGGRSPPTVTTVAAEPERAFEAVNVSMYEPLWAMVGVHEKVPDVLPAPAVNVLPVVAGVLTSVKDVIA